jgi:hypothetical protein
MTDDHEKALEAAARAIERQFDEYMDAPSQVFASKAITAYLAAREAAGWVMVPVEADKAMLDAFVSRALQVSIQGEGGWSEYGRNQWQQMLAARPRGEG